MRQNFGEFMIHIFRAIIISSSCDVFSKLILDKTTKIWKTSYLLFIQYVYMTHGQSSIEVTDHFVQEIDSKIGPQTLE